MKMIYNLLIIFTITICFGMIKETSSNVLLSNNLTFSSTPSTTSTETKVTSSSMRPTSFPLIPSVYNDQLSFYSGRFNRPGAGGGSNYYYQAIEIYLYTGSDYTISSNSSIDTYGYLYSGSFDASFPSRNLIAQDDDSGGSSQFRINATLYAGTKYILVVTTYAPNIMGSFSVIVLGPSMVNFHPYITTTVQPTPTTVSPIIPSYYSGALSLTSGVFTRPGASTGSSYYYQAIQVYISTGGKYTFTSTSSIDTYGYFYSGSFDSSTPNQNLIASDDDSGGSGQFRVNVTLSYGGTYILVVTTFPPNIMGSFSVTSRGPATVRWTSITPSNTILSSSLTSSSQKFSRPGGYSSNYYYQAIEVTVNTGGEYTFVSVSSMDTYGYLYRDHIDPSYPSENLIISNDDGAGNQQFKIIYSLQAGTTYVIVVTTFSTYVTGTFSLRVSGPSTVGLRTIRPIPSKIGPNIVVVTGIVIICVMFFGIVIGICVRRRNQHRIINRSIVFPSHNSYVQSPIYSVTRPNTNQKGVYVEKPPPSYNSITPTFARQQ